MQSRYARSPAWVRRRLVAAGFRHMSAYPIREQSVDYIARLTLAQHSAFALLRVLILTDLKLGHDNWAVLPIALHGWFMRRTPPQDDR